MNTTDDIYCNEGDREDISVSIGSERIKRASTIVAALIATVYKTKILRGASHQQPNLGVEILRGQLPAVHDCIRLRKS